MATIKGFATGTVSQPAGTTALDTRKANAFHVVSDAAGVPRTGVIGANPSIVTTDASTAPMRVAVAKAGFVTSRSVGDGVIDWGNDGSVFVTVTAPLSNSHIVVIYAKHNDAAAGDPTSLPVIEAVAGAAAASPTKPTLPTGAEELATLLIPSTATSTQSSGVILTNTYKMTAAAGGVVELRNAAEQAAWAPANGGLAYRQDANALLVRRSGAWRSTGRVVEAAPSAVVFGPIPPVGTPLIEWESIKTVATNSLGYTSIGYPAGLFPNGIIVAFLDRHDEASGYGPMFTILAAAESQSLTSLNFRVYVSDGSAIGAFSNIKFLVRVVGW